MLSYAAQLNSIYLNLGAPTPGLLHTEGVDYTARGLSESPPAVSWVQRQLSCHFRERLFELPGAQAYKAWSCQELPVELRTPRWQVLCESIARWNDLGRWQQVWVARLLLALCMHHEVLRLVPRPLANEVAHDEAAAQLASVRATASVAVVLDHAGRIGAKFDRSDLLLLAEEAQPGSPARLNALIHLILQCTQASPDRAAAHHWATKGQACLEVLSAQMPSSLDQKMAISRFHRAVALVFLLDQNEKEVRRHMDIAEEHARAACATGGDGYLAQENLYSLLESRTKEMLLRRELVHAEHYARELVRLTPLDSKALIELGEVLCQKNEMEEALAVYMEAAQCGPPGEAIAWFMAGQCAQITGDPLLAQHCFLEALRCDPWGISSYRRLEVLNTDQRPTVGHLLSTWVVETKPSLQVMENASGSQVGSGKAQTGRVETGTGATRLGDRPLSFKTWLYRPFLDLGPWSSGPLHVYRVTFSISELEEEERGRYGLQRVLPSGFRRSLIHETGLTMYNLQTPLALPPELRTEPWKLLCQQLEAYEKLNASQRILVLQCLIALGFYRVVIELVNHHPPGEIWNEEAAIIAYMRATARYVLHLDSQTDYAVTEFQNIAEQAPPGSLVRANALLHMVVQSARDAGDVEAVRFWARRALEEITAMQSHMDKFGYDLLLSRYYRAASFAPMLAGEHHRVREEMDIAERLARSLEPDSQRERILKLENLHPLLESRTKEALWLGDLELAEARARELVDTIDPYDPKPRIELGEVLLKRGKVAEAAEAYTLAAQLGPPGTAIAWFMAGQCYEHLEQPLRACHCYLAAHTADPLGISALRRLHSLAQQSGRTTLAGWAQRSLEALAAIESPARGGHAQ